MHYNVNFEHLLDITRDLSANAYGYSSSKQQHEIVFTKKFEDIDSSMQPYFMFAANTVDFFLLTNGKQVCKFQFNLAIRFK